MVRDGWSISSNRYKSRSEGKARKIRTIAGRIAQIVSTSWASRILEQMKEFIIRAIIA